MIYRKQQYFDSFKCIAGKCPESCCEGWQIVIDDDSLSKYERINTPFGNRLKNSIDWEEGVFLQYEKRCAFLNDENLCDLQCELGENGLCNTCKAYPRHTEEFDGVREYSLSLSCPEAARMMLNDKSSMSFITTETDEDEWDEDFEDFDFLLYDQLEVSREKLFAIIQDRSVPIFERLSTVLSYGQRLQDCLDNDNIFEMSESFECPPKDDTDAMQLARTSFSILYELEQLHSDWKSTLDHTLSRLDSINIKSCPTELSIPAEQLLMFFVYTYFSGAVYDDCIYSKIALSVYSVCWIIIIYLSGDVHTLDELIRTAYRYAREVEHSDINLNLLEERLG